MALVCSVYGSEHRQLKRRALILSVFDLILIGSTIAFVILQLVSVGSFGNSSEDGNSTLVLNTTKNTEVVPTDDVDSANSEISINQVTNCENSTAEGCEEGKGDSSGEDEAFNYRTVVGARISLSIQLIIYSTQLGFGFLLFIAAYHNDSRNLHLWVLFSEVIVVIVGLNLFINFFGNFIWTTVILTLVYLVFKIFLIRLVRKFIKVNDLELTQFGSVAEFD